MMKSIDKGLPMKMCFILISFLFSTQTMAQRLDAESYFYIGKGVSIEEPYFEKSDGTRFSINVKEHQGQTIPEFAYLCSMYTDVPVDQILASAIVLDGTSGMLYSVNDGFSPVSYPHDYGSILSLMCFSDQYQSVPLGGKTTYSADGSMTVEFPTAEYEGKTYPIFFDADKNADDFCRLLGYSSLDVAKTSWKHRAQNTQLILFGVEFTHDVFFFSPRIATSNYQTFWSLDSFTCRPF